MREDEWFGEEVMKARRAISLTGQIEKIKNREDWMGFYFSGLVLGSIIGFSVGRGYEILENEN